MEPNVESGVAMAVVLVGWVASLIFSKQQTNKQERLKCLKWQSLRRHYKS